MKKDREADNEELTEEKLDKKEINQLFREYAENKDIEIRNQLIEEHLYIAEILAKRYVNKGIEYDDLFQVASFGLILAVDRYNPDKGFEFSSYATPTIIGEIKRHFRDRGWVIRVPRRIQEMSKRVNNARLTLSQELQKAPTIKDIAEHLDISEEEVLEVMEGSKVYTTQSLEAQLDTGGDENDLTIADLLGEDDSYFSKIETVDFIEKAIESLNEMEKLILKYRYFERRTQVSIAKKLEISQMTVSRIEKKIMAKFKEELKLSEDGPEARE